MLGCVKCLLGCFIPIGFPAGKFEQQDGPAPDYAQEKCWDCYGADNGPSALVPEGVGDKLPVDQRPADVFFIHPTGYFGAAWQMPPSDLPTGELTGLSMSRNASAFNSTCRIFAPRYRQATLSSFLDVDVPSAREAMDGAYADVRAAFQHYMDVQNRGRPFVIASHSQGGWHAMRLLQEFVEAKPLAEKFVAAYCLGSWLPEAMFLGKGAAFKQVHLSGGPEDLCCVAAWTLEGEGVAAAAAKSNALWSKLGHPYPDGWRTDGPKKSARLVGTNPLTWASSGPRQENGDMRAHQGMVHWCKGTSINGQPVGKFSELKKVFPKWKKPRGLTVDKLVVVSKLEIDAILQAEGKAGGFSFSVHEHTGQMVPVLPKELGSPSAPLVYHLLDFTTFWFNIRSNVSARVHAWQRARVTPTCFFFPPSFLPSPSREGESV